MAGPFSWIWLRWRESPRQHPGSRGGLKVACAERTAIPNLSGARTSPAAGALPAESIYGVGCAHGVGNTRSSSPRAVRFLFGHADLVRGVALPPPAPPDRRSAGRINRAGHRAGLSVAFTASRMTGSSWWPTRVSSGVGATSLAAPRRGRQPHCTQPLGTPGARWRTGLVST